MALTHFLGLSSGLKEVRFVEYLVYYVVLRNSVMWFPEGRRGLLETVTRSRKLPLFFI